MSKLVKCPTCGRTTPDVNFCQYCGRPLYSCRDCHSPVLRETVFCKECGSVATGEGRELRSQEKVSWLWWLLPLICIPLITLPWVGGIIAWAFIRHRDPYKAKNILWLGLSMTVIVVIIAIARVYSY